MTHPNKTLMVLIDVPIKILAVHLQYHQTHSSTALNINPFLKDEYNIKTHHFHKSKNNMADSVPPPTLDGSRTTVSSSDACITDKLNMHMEIFSPTSVSFPNNTTNQYKVPSLSAGPSLQFSQTVTCVDSNVTCVPEIITKVMI